jgi:hypothetical protein
MRVALCFWGIARSTDWTIESIETNIWKPLEDAGIEYDTFVHTFTLERPYTNSRAGEWNLELKNDIWKMLLPKKYSVEDQDIVDKTLAFQTYRRHGDPWIAEGRESYIQYSTLDNLIRMLYSLKKVTSLWKDSAYLYDAVLYLRPDVKFLYPLDVTWFSRVSENQILVPTFHCVDSWNDRFAIGTPRTMIQYGERFKWAYEYSQTHQLHSERFLSDSMKRQGIVPIPIHFPFRRIRADGSVCPSDMYIL